MARWESAARTLLIGILSHAAWGSALAEQPEPAKILPPRPQATPTSISRNDSPASPLAISQRRDETVLMVERVKDAVVNIHSERTVSQPSDDPFRPGIMQPQRVNGMGTGIVLDPRGYIVTNFHVIDDVQSLRVRLCDGTSCTARVLAADKDSDLALVKIDPPKPLSTVTLGTAQDLMLAEKVFAIGNAYGYEHTVTVGHVSAMKRDVTLNKEISYRSLIQTQTPINPGNSGGPLFNKLGEVIGVNVAIRAGAQNIAFAIPVDTMITKAAEMLRQRTKSARQGIQLADLHERAREDGPVRRWVEVKKLDQEIPGLKVGDVIEQLGDVPVHTTVDFERALIDRGSNAKPQLTVRRGEERITVELVPPVVERAAASPADVIWSRMGIKAVPVGAAMVTAVDKQLRGGLWLSEIAVGGTAAKAGLQRGDILIGLHIWETLNQDSIVYVLKREDLASLNPVKAFYIRDGRLREAQLNLSE